MHGPSSHILPRCYCTRKIIRGSMGWQDSGERAMYKLFLRLHIYSTINVPILTLTGCAFTVVYRRVEWTPVFFKGIYVYPSFRVDIHMENWCDESDIGNINRPIRFYCHSDIKVSFFIERVCLHTHTRSDIVACRVSLEGSSVNSYWSFDT